MTRLLEKTTRQTAGPTADSVLTAPSGDALAAGGRRGFLLRRLLVFSDLVALTASFGAMVGIRELLFDRSSLGVETIALFIALVPLWVTLAAVMRLYHLADRGLDYSVSDEIGPVFVVATVWNWIFLMALALLDPGEVLEVLPAILFWAASLFLVPLFRIGTVLLARGTQWYRQRVLVIGSEIDSGRVIRRVERHPQYALDLVAIAEPGHEGYFTCSPVHEPTQAHKDPEGSREHLHEQLDADGLVRLAQATNISRVIVATAPAELGARSELIRSLIDSGAHVDVISGDTDLCSSSSATLHFVEGLPVLTVPSKYVPQTRKAIKRSVDIAFASLGGLLLAPLLVVFAIGIKATSRGPVLFRQVRIGRNGKPFELLKYRTMVNDADRMKTGIADLNMHRNGAARAAMFKIPGDPRITGFGAFLRRWSLDELPQLWNVLKGEMSAVGPRPLIPEEARLVAGRYEVRLEMRPGITGPWQTLGRSDIGFEDMIKLDYAYVMTWTLAEDFKLMIRTVEAATRGNGAY